MPTIPKSFAPPPARSSEFPSWRGGRRWRRSTCWASTAGSGWPPTPAPARPTTRSTSRSPTAVVLGNEAHGLPPDLDAHLDGRVTVPMHGARGVAQRGDGGRRAVLRVGSPARPDGLAHDVARRARSRSLDVSDAAIGDAATLDDLAAAERALTGRGSPMARANEAIKDLEPADRPAAGKAVGAVQGARSPSWSTPSARSSRPPPPRAAPRDALDLTLGGHGRDARAPPPRHAGAARARGHLRGHGLPGHGRPGGRGRLAQLRGAQHGARASRPLDAGHALRRAGGARADPAAHAHVAGADPHDGAHAAADLRGGARPHLSQRDAVAAALAGVPPDRSAGGRPRHHPRRSLRHHRDVRARAVRRRDRSAPASVPTSSPTPSRRPSSR